MRSMIKQQKTTTKKPSSGCASPLSLSRRPTSTGPRRPGSVLAVCSLVLTLSYIALTTLRNGVSTCASRARLHEDKDTAGQTHLPIYLPGLGPRPDSPTPPACRRHPLLLHNPCPAVIGSSSPTAVASIPLSLPASIRPISIADLALGIQPAPFGCVLRRPDLLALAHHPPVRHPATTPLSATPPPSLPVRIKAAILVSAW